MTIIQSCQSLTTYLSNNDLEFFYSDQEELVFLENQNDTIILRAEHYFSVAEQTSPIALPDLNKREYGSSTLYFYDSLLCHFGILKYAEDQYFRLRVGCTKCEDQSLLSKYIHIDSVNHDPIYISGFQINNHYKVTIDSTTSFIKELYFAIGYGLLKLELEDGYTLELIPEEQ